MRFFVSQGTLTDENENKTKRHLVAHGDYSSTANCQTKNSHDISQAFGTF